MENRPKQSIIWQQVLDGFKIKLPMIRLNYYERIKRCYKYFNGLKANRMILR